MKKMIFLLGSYLLAFNFLFAQSERLLPDKSDQWILDKTIKNVGMFHMIKDCEGNRVILLKFKNNNTFSVQVSWKDLFVTEQVADWKESFAGQKKISLAAGQIIEAGCGETINAACFIIPEKAIPHYQADIRNFKINDVLVSELK